MISICIPVYNYDITGLVDDLRNQLIASGVLFEILVMDDASQPEYRTVNEKNNFPEFRYIQLPENAGRAKIRNILASEAKFRYLIFMDCDSKVAHDSYIENYLGKCHPGVVCYGGRIYHLSEPEDDTLLRWKYGVKRESLSVSDRRTQPNYGFCTNNFLIDREVFRQVQFNENLTGYGHEDTFFGLELLGNGIPVEHIDNPLIHLGLEGAGQFLEKTENSVFNLRKVEQILAEKYPDFAGHSRLMRSKILLNKLYMGGFCSGLFKIFRPVLKKNLLGRNPSLFLFDLYRLGYLMTQD